MDDKDVYVDIGEQLVFGRKQKLLREKILPGQKHQFTH